MKALLILLLICIKYVVPDDEAKYSLKIYPKKVKPGNIQLINAGKYKKSVEEYTKKTLGEANKEYTVFPFQRRANSKERQGIVDAPTAYFVPDDGNLKPRVKKVLPDYVWSLRRKRSAVPDEPKPEVQKVQAETTKVDAVIVKANVTDTATTSAKPTDKQTDKPTEKATAAINDKSRKNNPKPKSPQRSVGNKKPKAQPKPKGVKPKQSKPVGGKTVKPKPLAKRNNKKKPFKSNKGAQPKPKGKPKAKPKPKSKPKPKLKLKDRPKFRPISNITPVRTGASAKGKKQNKRKVSRRLIAARDALIEEYPYVVSIQKDDQHWCAGALLNPRLVITTANCMWKSSRISRMEIRAGSRNVDHGGQVAGISEVMKHPAWGIRKQPDHDVALVLLDRNLRFSDSIHGVDLPNRAMMPPFDDAWITSWGAERRDGVYEPRPISLQVYHSRLMDRGKCNNVTERFGVSVTENFICLAQTGKRAPCTRDTGAPAVSDGVLWGLASWGIRKLCGTERFPAMFSYIASQDNMDFIMNATHYLMADERHYPFLDRFPNIRARTTTTTTTEASPF